MVKQGQKDKRVIVKEIKQMIIPIRCYSCGKPIAHLWEKFSEQVKKGEDPKKVLDSLGLDRFCCRAQFLGHVELIDDVAHFKKF